ncbi:MAG: hypothetical protein M1838_002631 [Thelocarpon superellum]|nr:MAG: hypothetical protein M1838_002631 [Thelocarpon superellum]
MPPFVPRKRRRSSSPAPRGSAATPAKSSRRPTLFDALDAPPKSSVSIEENRAFLDRLNGEESDSSLTDISSADFEEVHLGPQEKANGAHDVHDDDEEEHGSVDWEDAVGPSIFTPSGEQSGDLELTLDETARRSLTNPHGTKKGPSKIERQIRIQTHQMHVQFLLVHNLVRNAWTCDAEVQHALVSQLSQTAQNEIDRWKRMSNHQEPDQAPPRKKAKGKKPARKKARDERRGRDWGEHAERLEEGAPNLSHGDPLFRLLQELAKFWRKRFSIDRPGLRKQGYQPLSVLEEELAAFAKDAEDWDRHGERVASVADFRQLAKDARGSRDVGAQLFTALLRGIGLQARLVTSLQPVGFGWSKGEEANQAEKKKKKKTPNTEPNSSSEDDVEGQIEPQPDDQAAGEDVEEAVPNTRRKRTSGATRKKSSGRMTKKTMDIPTHAAGDDSDDLSVIDVTPLYAPKRPRASVDADLPYPIYWTEVLSPVTNRYIPVDPLILNVVATKFDLMAVFEPRSAQAERAKQVMAYVVAYASDGTAKDVTVRYLKRRMWPGKTKGFRMPVEKVPVYNHHGKVKRREEFDWFKSVMSGYARSANQRTLADDLEEEQDLRAVQPVKTVGREDTLQGYKTSADFVLQRHLRREEALVPGAQHVKLFTVGKGDKAVEEKVYRRRDVVACKTSESWHKEGREVMAGEHPLKLVPMRAVTLTRKREIEQVEADVGEKPKQGLYSEDQTDWIIPPPIENGIIPRNAFGNIDCYVPSMVPQGAVHLPYRGLVKICRRLDISHAEAVVGFDFKSQRAVPLVSGVVIPTEHEHTVIEAWHQDEKERLRKEEGKREKMALGLWRKFLMGMRILARVRDEYGGDDDGGIRDEVNPFTNRNKHQKTSRPQDASAFPRPTENHEHDEVEAMSGFLPDAEQGGGGFFPAGYDEDEATQAADHGLSIEDDGAITKTRKPSSSETQSSHRVAQHELSGTSESESESESESGNESENEEAEISHATRPTSTRTAPTAPTTPATSTRRKKTENPEPRRTSLRQRKAAEASGSRVRSRYFEPSVSDDAPDDDDDDNDDDEEEEEEEEAEEYVEKKQVVEQKRKKKSTSKTKKSPQSARARKT